MSEREDDKQSEGRPWDPAGTQPKHDPDALLPFFMVDVWRDLALSTLARCDREVGA